MNFSFGSGHGYADYSEFVSKGLRFDVLAVAFEKGRGFKGHDRWLITVKVADREPEMLSLGSNPKRDEQLKAAQAHLEGGGTITNVKLRQSEKAYYFTDGER